MSCYFDESFSLEKWFSKIIVGACLCSSHFVTFLLMAISHNPRPFIIVLLSEKYSQNISHFYRETHKGRKAFIFIFWFLLLVYLAGAAAAEMGCCVLLLSVQITSGLDQSGASSGPGWPITGRVWAAAAVSREEMSLMRMRRTTDLETQKYISRKAHSRPLIGPLWPLNSLYCTVRCPSFLSMFSGIRCCTSCLVSDHI